MRNHVSGLYELVVVRNPKLELHQAVFSTFPDLNEYSMHDLYASHPTAKDMWLYQGRADDIIVLSSGEKLNPITLESEISNHPAVQGAVVVGQGRFQTAALIELAGAYPASEEERQAVLDDIWKVIEEANKTTVAHGRLQRDHLLLVTPDKPFPRAGKGTIQKPSAIMAYETEIDRLYTQADEAASSGYPKFSVSSLAELQEQVKAAVMEHLEVDECSDDDDIFSMGLDSLHVLSLQRQFQAGLDRREGIEARTIYANPSINALSGALWKILHPTDSSTATSAAEVAKATFDKYAEGLHSLTPKGSAKTSGVAKVILTGSTGSLGSYILNTLMNNEAVKEIWCLNRSVDGQEKQTSANIERGLRTDWAAKNVHFCKADLAKTSFGVSDADYNSMLEGVTHIIRKSIIHFWSRYSFRSAIISVGGGGLTLNNYRGTKNATYDQ